MNSDDDSRMESGEPVLNDETRWNEGVEEVPFLDGVEESAVRDELARALDEALAYAYEWQASSENPEAERIHRALTEIAERVGEPREDTDGDIED